MLNQGTKLKNKKFNSHHSLFSVPIFTILLFLLLMPLSAQSVFGFCPITKEYAFKKARNWAVGYYWDRYSTAYDQTNEQLGHTRLSQQPNNGLHGCYNNEIPFAALNEVDCVTTENCNEDELDFLSLHPNLIKMNYFNGVKCIAVRQRIITSKMEDFASGKTYLFNGCGKFISDK